MSAAVKGNADATNRGIFAVNNGAWRIDTRAIAAADMAGQHSSAAKVTGFFG